MRQARRPVGPDLPGALAWSRSMENTAIRDGLAPRVPLAPDGGAVRARVLVGAAAPADRPDPAGLADRRGRAARADRGGVVGRAGLHLQVRVGAAARPLRAAGARPPARLGAR